MRRRMILLCLWCSLWAVTLVGQPAARVETLLQTAFQQYQNRQYDAAATAFAQVCQAVPTHHQARQYLAWSLLMAGKTDLARPHVEYLYKLDARNAEYVKLYAAVNAPAASAVQSAGVVQWPVWLEKTARLIETISEPGDRTMARFDVLLGLNAHPAD